MSTVVVPAKGFARAKSRLRAVLGGAACAALARSLLGHVLDAAAACGRVTDVVVVTDGDDVAAVARARGLRCVRDGGEPPLRVAVDLGLSHARADDAALVLMSDLPWLTVADVDALLAGADRTAVVVGPDAHGLGTNALALARGVRMPTAFGGVASFRDHLARAASLGLTAHVHESPGVAFDVDTPDDLRRMGGDAARRRAG